MKKWTLRITICLILGVVTTFVIAIAAHWFAHPTTFVMIDIDAETLELVNTWADPGALSDDDSSRDRALRGKLTGLIMLQTFVEHQTPSFLRRERMPTGYRRVIPAIWLDGPAADWAAGTSSLTVDMNSPFPPLSEGDPGYGRFFPGPNSASALIKRTGWPLRVFRFDMLQRFAPDPNVFSRALWNLETSSGNAVAMRTALDQTGIDATFPTRIIIAGVAVNTLLFAACWFILLYAPVIVREQVRTRRGRCPMCAYDLRGEFKDGCPECGWNRASAEERT